MLNRKQLEDAKICNGNECGRCSLDGTGKICIDEVAQTALTLLDMLQKVVIAIDTDTNIFKVSDYTQSVLTRADNLLKEGRG